MKRKANTDFSPFCKEGETLIALAGNPNVGKSTVFNYVTGLKQHTGNWTGKTVCCAFGRYRHNGKKFVLADLPGTYSLEAQSKDEEAARNFLCSEKPAAVIVVTDATALERNLHLVLQILELGLRAVVCVNLIDEAARKGIEINTETMSKRLGVPVVATNAKNGEGMDALLTAAEKAAEEKKEHETGSALPKMLSEEEKSENDCTKEERYFRFSEKLVKEIVRKTENGRSERDRKIDRLLTSKRTGIPLMLLFLCLILWLTVVGANYPSELLSSLLFGFEKKLMSAAVKVGVPPWLREMLLEGMYRTVAWVVSVMLPPMAIFFPLFTLLEDVGYLPRIAFNLDKSFCRACAHGKQALTTCMGFGCNAVGVSGCNIIDSLRERLIAVLTNNFVPCNGRFPTIIMMSSLLFGGAAAWLRPTLSALTVFLLVLLGVFMTFFCSKLLSLTVLKGLPSRFTLELPPYRKPKVWSILLRSVLDRTIFVLGRAVCVAAPAGIFIWLSANLTISDVSILRHCVDFLDPFAKIFGLDGCILLAFLLGIPANEIVVPLMLMCYLSQGSLMEVGSLETVCAVLSQNGWTVLTVCNVLLFMLLHFPCATTLLTIKKETGSLKWTLLAFALPTVCGLSLCFLTNCAAKFLNFC